MGKNIVLLSDGTGNSAAKLQKTNVWRLYQSLDLADPTQQIAFYDDGVGTSSFKPLAILGGAFGVGLKSNLLEIYAFLCRNYVPGDRIYCFGFSRGAFTVRMLTGLILTEGLVSGDTEARRRARAKTAFREYRRKRFSADIPFDKIGRFIRDLFIGDRHYAARRQNHDWPDITFLGVWDTVAAYGLPIDELTRALNWVWRLYPKDREPPQRVERICHAIAIDDERNTFHPVLFNEQSEPGNATSTNISEERVTQVWFTGMHSNVGGGYPDDSLSGVSLRWMAGEAVSRGLILKPNALSEFTDPSPLPVGKLYDSRRGLGGLYRYLPRKIAALTNDTIEKGSPVVIARPKIHESVFERIAEGGDHYAPIGLPKTYAVVDSTGNITGAAAGIEHPTQSESRVNLQERVWDLVWWKRVAYFSSIIVAALLAAFPLYRHATVACEGPLCAVSPMIGWVQNVLPGFLDMWMTAYKSHPASFLALALLFVALLKIGAGLQGRILDQMRGYWTAIMSKPCVETPVAELPRGKFPYWLRTARPYQWFFLLMKRRILPAAFGIFAVVVLFGIGSRLLFSVFASAGAVCPSAADGTSDSFLTSSPCTAITTPVLKAGSRYVITLTVENPSEYKDATIPTALNGFGKEKMPAWVHIWAVYFRRHTDAPWFKPFARIGRTGTDEYPLNPVGSVANDGTYAMRSVIVARRSGPIYFYVNDAVLPVPNAWQYFYGNNHGKVNVSVEEIRCPADPCTVDIAPLTNR